MTAFSLSPSVNPPCSILCFSKFQCLYFKVFVQVLCFDFVCVSLFFSISLNIDGFCKIMKFVSDGFCKIINFLCDEMWTSMEAKV